MQNTKKLITLKSQEVKKLPNRVPHSKSTSKGVGGCSPSHFWPAQVLHTGAFKLGGRKSSAQTSASQASHMLLLPGTGCSLSCSRNGVERRGMTVTG